MTIIHLYAAKPGQGVSTTAALIATSHHRHTDTSTGVILVDATGRDDLAMILAAGHLADDLDRGELVDVVPGLGLIQPPAFDPAVLEDLAAGGRVVLVDHGTRLPPPGPGHRILVTRACYLALRHATSPTHTITPPDAVIVITEAARALGVDDVEHTLGKRVVATIAVDPAIARAVDSGLLTSQHVRGFRLDIDQLHADPATGEVAA